MAREERARNPEFERHDRAEYRAGDGRIRTGTVHSVDELGVVLKIDGGNRVSCVPFSWPGGIRKLTKTKP